MIMSRIGEFNVNWDVEEHTICDRHLKILLEDWKNPFYKNIKIRDGNMQCSFPEHKGSRPFLLRETPRRLLVTKSDLQRWLKKKKKSLLPVGTPLCDEDMAFLRGPEFDKMRNEDEFKIQSDDSTLNLNIVRPPSKKTQCTLTDTVQKAVKDLLVALKFVKNTDRREDWNNIGDRQRREKVRIASAAFDAVCESLAPDAKEELKNRVFQGAKLLQHDSGDSLRTLLTEIADLYERADTKMNKIFVLATVAHLPFPILKRFIPGLTEYYHKKAKWVKLKGSTDNAEGVRRVRYDEAKLDKLLEFILSPLVVLDLPFNERQENMDDGTTTSMPNLMRLQTIEEVYRMYLAYLKEEGLSKMRLEETTAKYIIKLVAPTRGKNLTCVDEKIADGMKAFDELFSTVSDLLQKDIIDKQTAAKLTKDLQASKSYLRGDFKVHVKMHSDCADHCATFALSDPNNPFFCHDCSTGPNAHAHNNICDSCTNVDTTSSNIKELLQSAMGSSDTPAEHQHFSFLSEECDLHADAIYEMKKHQVRAVLSHLERAEFVDKLEEGEALIVLDWAQKLTPFYAREKQVEYYAKTGIAYHISHALTKINGEEAEHLSIHIFEPGEKQDGTAVSLIVKAFLEELKEMGIRKVLIRSDCAGCYRNAPLVSSLFHLQAEIGTIIDGLLFSEAQAGKGPCDRGAARAKGKARDHVTSERGKVETKEDFFDALVAGTKMNGVSVHICSISNVKNVKAIIPNITSYFSFDFEHNGILVRRHRFIGDGVLHDATRIAPCKVQLTIIKSDGHTAEKHPDLFWLSKTSRHPRASKPAVSIPKADTPAGVLHCPENNCDAQFRSFHNLEKHIFKGKHKYILERKTLHDYCAEMASASVELMMSSTGLGSAVSTSVRGVSHLKQGWALREVKKRNANGKPARELIKQYFEGRRKVGEKAMPTDADRYMRNAKNPDGSIMIHPKDRLVLTQIKSIINGLLKKEQLLSSKKTKKKANVQLQTESSVEPSDDEDEDTDCEESDDEDALRTLILSHKDVLFEESSTEQEDGHSKKRARRSVS